MTSGSRSRAPHIPTSFSSTSATTTCSTPWSVRQLRASRRGEPVVVDRHRSRTCASSSSRADRRAGSTSPRRAEHASYLELDAGETLGAAHAGGRDRRAPLRRGRGRRAGARRLARRAGRARLRRDGRASCSAGGCAHSAVKLEGAVGRGPRATSNATVLCAIRSTRSPGRRASALLVQVCGAAHRRASGRELRAPRDARASAARGSPTCSAGRACSKRRSRSTGRVRRRRSPARATTPRLRTCAKDEFLAMLGHELRNPLSAVRNAVVAARLDAARRGPRALEIARRGVDQLARLVDDLLDVARITPRQDRAAPRSRSTSSRVRRARARGDASADRRRAPTSSTCRLARQSVRRRRRDAPRAGGREPRLATRRSTPTRAADIAVRCSCEGGEVGAARARRRHRHRARDADARLRPVRAGRPRLAIAHRAGSASGSRSSGAWSSCTAAASRRTATGPARAAEFVVRLPASDGPVAARRRRDGASIPTPTAPVRARPRRRRQRRRGREPRRCCSSWRGTEVHVVANGAARARAIARACRAGRSCSSDIGLPGMDGYEVARAVRAARTSAAAVAWSRSPATGRGEDRERAIEAGFDRHLVKPVELTPLLELIGRVIRRGSVSRR